MKKCTACGSKMEPIEINKPACEAKCSKCLQWFCYEDIHSEKNSGMVADDGTLQCKREYDGTTNYRR